MYPLVITEASASLVESDQDRWVYGVEGINDEHRYETGIRNGVLWLKEDLDSLYETGVRKTGLTYGLRREYKVPSISKVIFNDPATIVIWADYSKTIVKCQAGDIFDPEKGLAMAIAKKALGGKGNYCNVFHKWLPKDVKSDSNSELADCYKTVTSTDNGDGSFLLDSPYAIRMDKESNE